MRRYEYKVVPAPTKGVKAKGVKTPEGRFSNALQEALNGVAGDGWEYCRAELLPSEERTGLTGSTTNWRNVLVFRREIEAELVAQAPAVVVEMPKPEAEAPVAVPQQPQVRAAEPSGEARKAESLITVSGLFSAQNAGPDEEGAENGQARPERKLAEKT